MNVGEVTLRLELELDHERTTGPLSDIYERLLNSLNLILTNFHGVALGEDASL